MQSTTFLSLLAAIIAPVAAQTWSACNPTNSTTCTPNPALGVSNYTMNFQDGQLDTTVWNETAGSLNYDSGDATFVINQKGDSPTIQSNFYIFFGVVEVIMKAASGQGIISSIVMESDDLDEVDWELMGGNTTFVETNYFGKGNTTAYDRAIYYPLSDAMENYHNYTTVWTSEQLQWLVDGNVVRTLKYGDALGGYNYPQTPMNIRIGIWAGGDSKEAPGIISWAGGVTDYSKGPFDMHVRSIRATDYSKGTDYKWSDKTGSFKSILIENPAQNSTIADHINAPPPETIQQKWNDLSPTAKIAIYASVAAFVAISVGLLTCCCIRQRRAGRREREVEEAAIQKRRIDDNAISKDTLELMAHRAEAGTGGHGYERGYGQHHKF